MSAPARRVIWASMGWIRSAYRFAEGSVTPGAMLGVIRAADATAIAEEYRARALRGEQIVMDDLVRLENTAARTVKALGLKRDRVASPPSLQEHLARKYGGAK